MSIFQDVTNALRKAGEKRKEEHITCDTKEEIDEWGKGRGVKAFLESSIVRQ